MIKFIKTPDPNNHFDLTTVEISLEDGTASDLVETFKDFMLAIGYHPDTVKEYLNTEE